MKKKDLSIIIPVYNVELFLKECLDSVYAVEEIDYEVILINDGSLDNSLKILEDYRSSYPEKTKLINKKNGGQSSARNLGLQVAKGEYISFIDSDDFINSKEFSKFFKSTKRNNLEIGVGTLYRFQNNKIEKIFRKIEKNKNKCGLKFVDECLRKKSHRTEACINLYKKDFLVENNLKFKEGVIYEDALFIMKAFYYAKSVMYFEIPFYYYRFNPESTMNKKVTEKNYLSAYIILDELIKFYEKHNIKVKSWRIFLMRRYFYYLKNWGIKNCYLEKKVIKFTVCDFKDFIRKIYIIFYFKKVNLIDFKK